MRHLFDKDLMVYFLYIVLVLLGIWFLTKLWVPDGFAIAGHDSGLALNSGDFLKTRFFAWDDRVNFGSDNSPHFGSIILHGIDYILALVAHVPNSGSQMSLFFWMTTLFLFGSFFSYSLKYKLGKYFPYLFPLFLVFNFFIFQSIFILERAKYELLCGILLFLTFGFKIFFNQKESVLRDSIVFSVVLAIFNGGSWLGLPLYGGLLVTGIVFMLFVFAFGIKEKNYDRLVKIVLFLFFSVLFFVFLNLYSLLPFISTLRSSGYAEVVNQGTIDAGREWLDYISRGSSWLNLLRFQGVPEWYLTGSLQNPDYSYAARYLSNDFLVFVSFVFPVIALLSAFFSKEKDQKYLISFFIFLFLVSMFFTSGTNSPLGFIYDFFYNKIPGFSIFRSPYYKFASSYVISFAVLLAFSFAGFAKYISMRILVRSRYRLVAETLIILAVLASWLWYHSVAFDRNNIFDWQPDKSTLVRIPTYVSAFNSWLEKSNLNGRILMVPAFDGASDNDSYTWGYWSLSSLPAELSANKNFVANDTNLNRLEGSWINKEYSLLLGKDFQTFLDVSNKLGIKYLFVRNDFLPENEALRVRYLDAVNYFLENGNLTIDKNFGPWTVYSIRDVDKDNTFSLSNQIFSIPSDHIYLAKEMLMPGYLKSHWVEINDSNNNLASLINQEFYPLNCDSCQIENLGLYADYPKVRILPNSPLYPIKKSLNETSLKSAKNDNSKLGAYLGLVMIKLSEIRSMYDLGVDKQSIFNGLKDMNLYLQGTEALIANSQSLKSNFYFAAKVYGVLNPVQRYFRDYIGNSNFGLEKSAVKDKIYQVLWDSVSIKKTFDNLTANRDRWNYEKLFNFSLPRAGQYSILIDSQTLPVDLKGGDMLPYLMNLGESSQGFIIKSIVNDRWVYTSNVDLPRSGDLHLYFRDLPDLFSKEGLRQIDFPQGTRGCLIGEIKFFNKNRSYKLRVLSTADIGNLRLYIKENGDQGSNRDGFLRGDIEMDIATAPSGGAFTYIYSPVQNANNPQIYLCRYDDVLPVGMQIGVTELFSPSVYMIRTNNVANVSKSLDYKKVDPTRYELTVGKADSNMVLVFNQSFNNLWELYDNNSKKFLDHFVVDGYSNGWFLAAGKDYKLSLIYRPQTLFEKGVRFSIASALFLLVIYLTFLYMNKRYGKTRRK